MGRTPTKANKPAGRKLLFDRWPKAKTDKNPLAAAANQIDFQFEMSVHDATQPIASINSEKRSYTPKRPASAFSSIATTNTTSEDQIEGNEQSTPSFESQIKEEETYRQEARTMSELIDQIKKPIEEDTSKIIVMEFDEMWTSLAKAATQKQRRAVLPGSRLFRKFCQDNNIKCENVITSTFVGALEEPREIDVCELRLKNLVNGVSIIYVRLDDDHGSPIEIRLASDQFLTMMAEGVTTLLLDEEIAELVRVDSESLPPFTEFLRLDRRVPERLSDYMNRDRNNRCLLIRFICSHLLSKTSPKRLKMRDGALVIISGHHMNHQTLFDIGFDEETISSLSHSEETAIQRQIDIRSTPISVGFNIDPETGLYGRVVKLELALQNKWGETDFGAYFFARALGKSTVKMISTDTDWINYGLAYLLKTRYTESMAHLFQQQIVLYRRVIEQGGAKRKKTDQEDDSTADGPIMEQQQQQQQQGAPVRTKRKIDEWIHINSLYDYIKNDPRLSHLKDAAVSSIIAVNTLAGCDYMYPYYFVSHRYFFDSLIEFSIKLRAPLCLYDASLKQFSIQQSVFMRYLSLAYALKFVKHKSPLELLDKTPEEISREVNKQKDKKKHFPTPKDCAYSFKQLLFCFCMMNDLGQDQHSDHDLKKFGYASNDPDDTELTYDNIERLIDCTN